MPNTLNPPNPPPLTSLQGLSRFRSCPGISSKAYNHVVELAVDLMMGVMSHAESSSCCTVLAHYLPVTPGPKYNIPMEICPPLLSSVFGASRHHPSTTIQPAVISSIAACDIELSKMIQYPSLQQTPMRASGETLKKSCKPNLSGTRCW